MKVNNSILLTGGHAATTALATIEELNKRGNFESICWIGNKKAFENSQLKTIESDFFKDLKVDHYEIDSGRLQRKWTPNTIKSLLKIPLAFLRSYTLVNKIKPKVVVSFGGAISLPVVFSAWLQGIPIVIHEQTVAAGLANRLAAIFAEKIALARLESRKYFDKNKTVHVGNPISSYLRKVDRSKFKANKEKVIFITGGSRGSVIINDVIFKSVDLLTKKYKLIHQTGEIDIKKAEKINNKNYKAFARTSPDKLKEIYENCDLVIARAGANTVAEMIAFSIPSIFIPIPWVQHNEQFLNAKLSKKSGNGMIIEEKDLSKDSLVKSINKVFENYKKYSSNKILKTTSKDLMAHENLVDLISELVD